MDALRANRLALACWAHNGENHASCLMDIRFGPRLIMRAEVFWCIEMSKWPSCASRGPRITSRAINTRPRQTGGPVRWHLPDHRDFTFRNCINSDIRKVLVLPQYKANSLNRHLDLRDGRFLCRELGE